MTSIVECVPNVSEGRDARVISELARAIGNVHGLSLFDTSSGISAHRTVFTFIGTPEQVLEGAYQLIYKGHALVDLRRHQGTHPRIGAVDVCPFVPLHDVSMSECIAMAHRLAARIAVELSIPSYLYGLAARDAGRRELGPLRRGGFENLSSRMNEPRWRPDYGPPCAHPSAGVTLIGARNLMIAYNVNLKTDDVEIAAQIAAVLRESGIVRRDEEGRLMRDREGVPLRSPGLPACRAIGWSVPEYGCAQVSCNLLDYRCTGLHDVYIRIRELANAAGTDVAGSEIIGLVPEGALVAAGSHFLGGARGDLPEEEAIRLAVDRLGLAAVAPFDPDQKILEVQLRKLDLPVRLDPSP